MHAESIRAPPTFCTSKDESSPREDGKVRQGSRHLQGIVDGTAFGKGHDPEISKEGSEVGTMYGEVGMEEVGKGKGLALAAGIEK